MPAPNEVRLITLDPAHFHAALLQKQMLPEVARRVTIYAPLGPDLVEHLKRIERFNARADRPTEWELDIHCGPDSLERLVRERPGNVVVLSGRNRLKIAQIAASLDAGLHVLADKPWIIRAADFQALESALDLAARKGLVAYDMMTERYEITSILQRALVQDAEVFGVAVPGSDAEPGVSMESVHHIMKTVAGVPGLRPPFFFDIEEEGEGLADVGTHLVDLVAWTLFPNQVIDYREDIKIQRGRRWPTVLTQSQFQQATGAAGFPTELAKYVRADSLDYYCNNEVHYQLRGVNVRLAALWNYESPAGVDLHHATYRGTNSSVEVRQGKPENYRAELYVVPNGKARRAAVAQALRNCISGFGAAYPGLTCEPSGEGWRVIIPERYRVGHEAHFAQVVVQFLEYLKSPATVPAWERPNMLAKYYVTTEGVRLSGLC